MKLCVLRVSLGFASLRCRCGFGSSFRASRAEYYVGVDRPLRMELLQKRVGEGDVGSVVIIRWHQAWERVERKKGRGEKE